MRKISLFLGIITSAVCVFGYSSADVSNAEFLANQGIITSQSSAKGYRLDDNITRAEAIGIVLKIKGVEVPSSYMCKGIFQDSRYEKGKGWVCQTIEIAAREGIITTANKRARPNDKITRIEILFMLARIPKIKSILQEFDGYNLFVGKFDTKTEAENLLLSQYFSFGSILNYEDYEYKIVPVKSLLLLHKTEVKFYPYRVATRAEVFGFAKASLVKDCILGGIEVRGPCILEKQDNNESIYYGKYVEVPAYGDSLYLGYECAIREREKLEYGIMGFKKFGDFDAIWNSPGEAFADVYIPRMEGGYYVISNPGNNLQNCTNIKLSEARSLNNIDILKFYYDILNRPSGQLSGAYNMRSPSGVSLETFQSWYENVTSVVFREDTIKNLGDNTYEFLVDMTENGIKSTYKVKSKVDLENFKINNISSVKQ